MLGWSFVYLAWTTFVWPWLCSNLCLYDIDLHCMSGSYVQVWVLYHMDLHCILVAMVVYSSHGFSLYWSVAMSWLHLSMSQKYWCIAYAYSTTLSDQADSHLEVTTCSLKALSYRIPLSLTLWREFCIPKSCHQHVMRSLTPIFSLNRKLGVETCFGCQSYMKNPSTAFSL